MIDGVNEHSALSGKEAARNRMLSYLKELGLDDEELSEATSILQPERGEVAHSMTRNDAHSNDAASLLELEDPVLRPTIKLYLAEEQKFLRDAYRSMFEDHATIDLMGYSDRTSAQYLVGAVTVLRPHVMLLGVRAVSPATVRKLETLRDACPDVRIVLLFGFLDDEGIKALRQFSTDQSLGRAYLPKYAIDTAEQLTRIVHEVADNRVVLDPTVIEGLITDGEDHTTVLNEFSARELETLAWLAKGYRNETIASVLGLDVKTIDRNVNKISAKLQDPAGTHSMDSRVRAARMYLKAVGQLPADRF